MWRTLQGAGKTLCCPVTLCLFGLASSSHPWVLGLCDGSAVRITSGERKTVFCGHEQALLTCYSVKN